MGPKKDNFYRVLFSSCLGNVLEHYDLMLVAYFSPILIPIFMPQNDGLRANALWWMSLAIGYFTRPLGAIFFGWIGDRFGRKKALTATLYMMGFSTAMIGLLPGYQAIGWWAPALFIVCRLGQGFSIAGEYIGAAIYSLEHGQKKEYGLISGIIVASGVLGMLLSNASLNSYKFFASYSREVWRLYFMVGAFIALVGWYLRKKLTESPDFEKVQQASKDCPQHLEHYSKNFLDLIKLHFKPFLSIFFLGGFCGGALYLVLVHPVSFIPLITPLKAKDVSFMMSLVLIFYGFLLVFFGIISKKLDSYRQMLLSAITLGVISIPLYMWFLSNPSSIRFAFVSCAYSFCLAMFAAPSHLWISKLFPVAVRYRLGAFGFGLGMTLFGTPAPFFASFLADKFSSSLTGAAILSFSSLLGVMCAFLGKREAACGKNFTPPSGTPNKSFF